MINLEKSKEKAQFWRTLFFMSLGAIVAIIGVVFANLRDLFVADFLALLLIASCCLGFIGLSFVSTLALKKYFQTLENFGVTND